MSEDQRDDAISGTQQPQLPRSASSRRPPRLPARPGQFFEPDTPTVESPEVGDVYVSETAILYLLEGEDRRDVKLQRPVVVVRAATRTYPRVHVCVRRSLKRNEPTPSGVPHPADLGLGLDLPGVWLPTVKWTSVENFAGDAVEYRGKLASAYLDLVLAMVRSGV